MAFDWNKDALAMLDRLLKDGLSASEIANTLAAAFGAAVTKNSVIGKVHRIKGNGAFARSPSDSPAPKTVRKPRTQRKKEEAMPAIPAIEPFFQPAPPIIRRESGNVSLMELTATTCRWPIGNPGDEDFRFCGDFAVPGKPYCPACAQLAYVPIDKRRRAVQWKFK